ncbi:hypothetical protein [Flavobacterium sp.]|uniref:hypothetical protein n=1 Tax=Flavobacterium sp. TaxID=239 RepID=UPI00333F7750
MNKNVKATVNSDRIDLCKSIPQDAFASFFIPKFDCFFHIQLSDYIMDLSIVYENLRV